MRIFDRMAARLKARADRKMMEQANAHAIKVLRRPLPAPGDLNRAQRRATRNATGPWFRQMRLQTHMRRPLVAVHCRGEHKGTP